MFMLLLLLLLLLLFSNRVRVQQTKPSFSYAHLRCSHPIQRNCMCAILRKSSFNPLMQATERELAVSVAPP